MDDGLSRINGVRRREDGVLEPWPVAHWATACERPWHSQGSGLVCPIGAKGSTISIALDRSCAIRSGWIVQKVGGWTVSSFWRQDNLVVGSWNSTAQT